MAEAPRTQKEFIEYRLNETNSKIDTIGHKVDTLTDKLDNNFATKDYVNTKISSLDDALQQTNDKLLTIYKIVGGAVGIILAAVLVTLLYSIGLRLK
jgi:septation ring formation regulator EzrA